jgi:hypothetical protein
MFGASQRRTLGFVSTMTLATLSSAKTVHADDPAGVSESVSSDAEARKAIDRTWLYTDDGRIAEPLQLIATSSVAYTSVGNSPSRVIDPFPGCVAPCNSYNAFAANTATPGGMLDVGGEFGLLPRLSVAAVAQIGLGGSDNTPSPSAGVVAGLRLRVSPQEWRDTHIVVSGGYLREAWQGPVYDDDNGEWHGGSPNGDNGAWLRAAISADVNRLRLAGTVHGEHVFSAGRDPLDVMVEAGASYRIVGGLRGGVEYVGQDLEEAFTPGAEGGARHFLGPIASLQLLGDRLSLVAGPSVGLTTRSPDFIARASLSYGF